MKKNIIIIVIGLVALLVLLVTPFIGMKSIPLSTFLNPLRGSVDARVLFELRIPRVLTAFMAGASLAIGGMVFQTMFQNSLATPFTLGVASGASLGAAVYVRLGLCFSLLGLSGISVSAFAGALLSVAFVYGVARTGRMSSVSSMLLAGVAVSFFFSSLILLLQYLSDYANSFRILRWLMGGIEAVGFGQVFKLLPFFVSGTVVILLLTRELNLIAAGEEIAVSRGVDIKKIKFILFFSVSLMVGGVVSVCGPIGFVGIMAPHICRILVGWNHKQLTAATILFGGAFLTVCDTVARTLIAPAEIPVGVITALLGGPFFLWLLLSNRSKHGTG